MASQMINNSWRNSRLGWQNFMVIIIIIIIIIIYSLMVIRITYPNRGHDSDFLCFSLMNY